MNAEELAPRLRMLCQFLRFNFKGARRVSLLQEISMLPIQALSIRTCATMFPPSSATAMFMGWPISLAFFSAALITRRASSSFTDMDPPYIWCCAVAPGMGFRLADRGEDRPWPRLG